MVCGRLTGCETSHTRHTFTNQTPWDREEFQSQGYHSECKRCVNSWNEELDMEVCHPLCTVFGDEEQELAFLAMIETRDLRGLLAVAHRAPHRIVLNESRQSLQVVDCDGGFVVNLPLGELYREAVIALAVVHPLTTHLASVTFR